MNLYCRLKKKLENILIMEWFHYSAIYIMSQENCANINNTDQNFLGFYKNHLFYDNDNDENLPIMVYSGIKTSMVQNLFSMPYYPWVYFLQITNFF